MTNDLFTAESRRWWYGGCSAKAVFGSYWMNFRFVVTKAWWHIHRSWQLSDHWAAGQEFGPTDSGL